MKVNIENIKPQDIEKRSFELIGKELEKPLDPILEPVIKRVIHTTADFDYINNLVFSDQVIEQAQKAIKRGVSIVTDTNMAKSGINKKSFKRFGGHVHCFMADEDIAEKAKRMETTRAVCSMEKAAALTEDFIYVIGNAPTALIRLYELIQDGTIKPALIVGVPVGFVNVIEAKELILKTNVPYIIAKGRKGGSNVAASIINAILYMI